MTEIEAANQGASFSSQAWSRNAGLYEAIRTMPFNAELAAGVLSEARFRHYITQDAHYLVGFGRALAIAAAKAPNPDRIVQFAKGTRTRGSGSRLSRRVRPRARSDRPHSLRPRPI
jgi:thiaminase (transcriptional activator TenA)